MKSIEFVFGRVLQHCASGSICYAEVWNIVAARLEHENVEEALEGLSSEQKRGLCAAYCQAPLSLNCYNPPSVVREQIRAWLENAIS